MALQGSKGRERYSFPGFESLFKTELTIDRNPVVLPDFSRESFAKALQTVKSLRDSHPTLVPVFVLPSDDDNGYLEHKAVFANAGIATQVCTLRIINDDYALKWAIANIALQIFCKSGGQPWKVRPTKDRSLIVGISQSHKLRIEDGKSSVEKYFAFSVLTDNSGLYQKIEILGDSGSKHDYLSALKSNLDRILTHDSEGYSQVVLHTSFKIKNDELDQIERAVRDASSKFTQSVKKFAVVKVNHKNRFFGFNPEVNSLVPYEGSVARLGWGEYLLWFEGIFPEKPTVNKAFAGPTHIEFLRGSSSEGIDDNAILQDLVNLSGANWRGFNAKSAPVSVFYCHLVADLVQSFQSHGLPLPKVTDLKPWFL
jgi:hypothetical protein